LAGYNVAHASLIAWQVKAKQGRPTSNHGKTMSSILNKLLIRWMAANRTAEWLTVIALLSLTNMLYAEAAGKSEAAKSDSAAGQIPPDLPLPASPALPAKWLREATVLQPYGHSSFEALVNPGDRPRKLREEFGFNAIIVQPPDSHNTIVGPNDKLTEEQFRAGVAAYRAAGYKLMLYTSLMALGLSPEFQSGAVDREHPDWLQRDPKGNPVMVWGVPWLCPSTGARQAALDRCVRIAREYQADGVMLDNNQFYFADAGWTCHCEACNKAFREYVERRCGAGGTRQLFGVEPAKIRIPSEEGPLFALWMHWRNRVWAEVNESFRARLRKDNPEIMFFANTQYQFDTGVLASDLQYAREDVVLSETVGLNAQQTAGKMNLGHALAEGRPLWNYIGTFAKADDYTGLLPAERIRPMIISTIAHGARPWIVDGFDEGPTDPAARAEMSQLLGWHARHPELYSSERWAEVGTLISLTSRNALKRPLIPPHLTALRAAGTPIIALRDDTLTVEKLRPFRVLTIETAACLGGEAANAIAEWVREGGVLVAARDTGSCDELGRKRWESTLWKSLGVEESVRGANSVGRGVAISPEAGEFVSSSVGQTRSVSFRLSSDSDAEIVAYRGPQTLLLHVIRHAETDRQLKLGLPKKLRSAERSAELFTPARETASALPIVREADYDSIELPADSAYSVLRIRLP
jgi:hypothetical protein